LPQFWKRGLGLDILERASHFALERNRNRLIGNANLSDRFIINHYKSLGAEVIQTGMGGGGGDGANIGAVLLVRLVRDIPDTFKGMEAFFASLREQRRKKKFKRHIKVVTRITVVAAIVTLASLIYRRGRRRALS